MITNTMNIEEIAYEICEDLPSVGSFFCRNNIMERMKKVAKKKPSKRHHQIFRFKSKRYNNWLVSFDYLMKDPSWVSFCTYVNKDGFNAVMVISEPFIQLIHYSGHFLERYNQRFLDNKLENKSGILEEYMLRNSITYFKFPYRDERFSGVTHDGVVLGYLDKEINWFNCKTFITKDMLFNNQQATVDMASDAFEKYWNEVHCKTVIPDYYSTRT